MDDAALIERLDALSVKIQTAIDASTCALDAIHAFNERLDRIEQRLAVGGAMQGGGPIRSLGKALQGLGTLLGAQPKPVFHDSTTDGHERNAPY